MRIRNKNKFLLAILLFFTPLFVAGCMGFGGGSISSIFLSFLSIVTAVSLTIGISSCNWWSEDLPPMPEPTPTPTPEPTPPEPTPPTPPAPTKKVIFITSAKHDGDLSEGDGTEAVALSTADTFCNNNKPVGVDGTFKALLFTSTRYPCSTPNCTGPGNTSSNWVLAADTEYYRTDETTLIGTTNSNAIFDTTYGHYLDNGVVDEYGYGQYFWSGANPDWTIASDNCQNFTSNYYYYYPGYGTYADYGSTGYSSYTDQNFLNYYNAYCNSSYRLICVEQ